MLKSELKAHFNIRSYLKRVHLVKVLNCFSLSDPESACVNLKPTTFREGWTENTHFYCICKNMDCFCYDGHK